jgi:GGDEF domain-containing protein
MSREKLGGSNVYDRVLLGAMAFILAALAVTQWARKMDTPEVVATLLLLVVLLGIALFEVVGGVAVGALATIAYGLLRARSIDVVGSAEVFKWIALHGLVFIGFGAAGGAAHRVVSQALSNAASNEQIDPRTGCAGSRSIVQILDSESARTARYKREFSVITIDLGDEVIGGLPTKQQTGVRKELGELLRTSIRTTDRVGTVAFSDRERIVLILPETPLSGAQIFLPRIVDKISTLLLNRNVAVPRKVGDVYSTDNDASHIKRIRNEIAREANMAMTLDVGSA